MKALRPVLGDFLRSWERQLSKQAPDRKHGRDAASRPQPGLQIRNSEMGHSPRPPAGRDVRKLGVAGGAVIDSTFPTHVELCC